MGNWRHFWWWTVCEGSVGRHAEQENKQSNYLDVNGRNVLAFLVFRTQSDGDETSEDENDANFLSSKRLRLGDSSSRAKTGKIF